jgi:hypothetical protein
MLLGAKNEVICAEAGSLAAEGSDYFFDLSLLMKSFISLELS